MLECAHDHDARWGAAHGGPAGGGGGDGGDRAAERLAPSLSNDGPNTLVVYQVPGGTDSYEIFGRIMSADTKAVGSPFVIAQNTSHRQIRPDVAWNGSNWLVVFEQQWSATDDDILGQIVSPSGTMVGGPVRLAGSGAREQEPAVTAGANGEWGVTWTSDLNAATTLTDVYFRRVSAGGSLPDTSAARLSADVTGGAVSESATDLAFNGSEYRVVWQGVGGGFPLIEGAEVNAAGTVTSRAPILGTRQGTLLANPAIAAGGGVFLLVYEYRDFNAITNGVDIDVIRFEASGDSNFGHIVSAQAGDEGEPAITYNGGFLVAWRDRRQHVRHRVAGDAGGLRLGDPRHGHEVRSEVMRSR